MIGVADEEAGELPKAYIVPGEEIDHDELMAWVGERVAPQKKIRLVEEIDEIPKSPSGKILRRKLVEREREAAGGLMEAATRATMVPGYRHVPGNHCGSTALRNLLAFHGLELTEEMAFGLGAGACFYYVVLDDQSPSRFTNGRVSRLEEQFVELTGAPLELHTFDDAEASWDGARETVDGGRPAILLSDLYHLDHYGKSAHFPGHAVVLAGYDDELAYLSDTAFEELQTTRLENLAKARHESLPVFPLDGHMFTLAGGRRARRPDRGRACRDRVLREADARAADGRVRGAARRCAASPTRSAPGRRRPRTGSGARASTTR